MCLYEIIKEKMSKHLEMSVIMNDKEFDLSEFTFTDNNTMKRAIKTVFSVGTVPDIVKNSHIFNEDDYWN